MMLILLKFTVMKNLKFLMLFTAIAAIFAMVSCNEQNDKPQDSALKVSTSSLEFNKDGGAKELKITTTVQWKAVVDDSADWCTLSSQSGTGDGSIVVTVSKIAAINQGARQAVIVVTSGKYTQRVTVNQFGNESFIKIDTAAMPNIYSRQAQNVKIRVHSNVAYSVASGSSWVTVAREKSSVNFVSSMAADSVPGLDGGVDQYVLLDVSIAENSTMSDRVAEVVFTQTDALQGKIAATFTLHVAQQGPSDREALLEFYRAIGSPAQLVGWGNSDMIEFWEGVSVNSAGEVTGIVIPKQKLAVAVKPEMFVALAKLGSLDTLDLSGNELSGVLPADVGQCLSLTLLNLSNNDLSGKIPGDITKITKLKILDLSYNQLEGEVMMSLPVLSALVVLNVSHNLFTGEISPYFGSMCVPKTLLCNNNLLSGSIPASLADIKQMRELNLSHNNLSGDLPDALKAAWPEYKEDICPQIGGGLSNCD